MRKIGVGREHRAQGGLIQQNPELVLFIVLLILLFIMAVLKGMDHTFFRLGFISNTIYNALVIITGIFGYIVVNDWLKRRNVAIVIGFVIIFTFLLFGEVIGLYVLSTVGGG